MIVFPRGLIRSFRAIVRHCTTSRLRGPGPPVEVRANDNQLSLTVRLSEATVTVAASVSSTNANSFVVVPGEAFAAVDTAAEVQLDVEGSNGRFRWPSRTGDCEHRFTLLRPGREHQPLLEPESLVEVPDFAEAVAQAAEFAAREPSARYALSCVQLQGKSGRVIGTNGSTALIRSGVKLPFTEDVLIPALSVFAHREFAGQPVLVGIHGDDLIVRRSPWTLRFRIDRKGQYPDVVGVVPRHSLTRIQFDDGDADQVTAFLESLPQDEESTVTLIAESVPILRAKVPDRIESIRLRRSRYSGEPNRVAVSATALVRGLKLGGRTIRFSEPGKPFVVEADKITVLALTLDASAILADSPASSTALAPLPSTPRNSMPPAETNGRHLPAPDETVPADGDDPLTVAEALHAELADLALRSARLVRCLKLYRRERKALRTAFSSLKALGLEGGRP